MHKFEVAGFKGKPIADMSRDELIDLINGLARENDALINAKTSASVVDGMLSEHKASGFLERMGGL